MLITPQRIDLGNITWGEAKDFSIYVYNNSDKVQSIKKIVTFCRQLWVDRSVVGKPIKPHSKIVIKGKFIGKVLGYFGKAIIIYTSHPQLEKFEVDVVGKVVYPEKVPRLELQPRKVDLGALFPGEKKPFSIIVHNKGNGNLFVEYEGTGQITRKNKLLIQPNKKVEIGLQFVAGNEKGKFREIMWIKSNDPFKPKVPVVVKGVIVGEEGGHRVSLTKLTPLFLFLTGITVIVFAVIKYA